VFLDLGANAGAYSFWAYNRLGPACRIVAVEPDPELYARLAFNIATNRASITPVRAALGDHPGRLPLFINPERRGQNSLLARPGASQPAESVVVDVMTLPDLLAAVAVDHVDVMKIDLEGMEYPVLHHFFQTAGRRLWPRVLVTEFKGTEEHRRLLAELDALGYGVCARTRENVVLERS
jgi:FkbM family methyltransferase